MKRTRTTTRKPGRLVVGSHTVNAHAIGTASSSPPANSRQNGQTSGAQTTEVIDSRIDGEFEGWDGESVFRQVNGQIWQQASYAYVYHYVFMPKVLIFKMGNEYQMQVEGVQQRIAVWPLINLKTAMALGLTVPATLLAHADEVIE